MGITWMNKKFYFYHEQKIFIMKKVKNLMIYALATTLVFGACKKDDDDDSTPADKTKPTATLDKPSDGMTMKAGEKLHIEGTVTDETSLKSYTLTVSGGLLDTTVSISGKEHDFHMMVDVLKSGTYSVAVTAKDGGGNVSDEATASVKAETPDSEGPKVISAKVLTPASGKLESGSTANKVEFEFSDNMELGEITIVLNNTEFTPAKDIWSGSIPASETAGKKTFKKTIDVSFSGSNVVATDDDALWKIVAKDANGNETKKDIPVIIRY
jgi:hypothetical protein